MMSMAFSLVNRRWWVWQVTDEFKLYKHILVHSGVKNESWTLWLMFLLTRSLPCPPFPRSGVSVCEGYSSPLHHSPASRELLHDKIKMCNKQSGHAGLEQDWSIVHVCRCSLPHQFQLQRGMSLEDSQVHPHQPPALTLTWDTSDLHVHHLLQTTSRHMLAPSFSEGMERRLYKSDVCLFQCYLWLPTLVVSAVAHISQYPPLTDCNLTPWLDQSIHVFSTLTPLVLKFDSNFN